MGSLVLEGDGLDQVADSLDQAVDSFDQVVDSLGQVVGSSDPEEELRSRRKEASKHNYFLFVYSPCISFSQT